MAERLNLVVESRRDQKRLDGETLAQRDAVDLRKRIDVTLAAGDVHHGTFGLGLGLATCALALVIGFGGYAIFHRDSDLEATAGAACVSFRDSVVSVAADCRAPVELARGHDIIDVKPGTVLSESKAGIRVRRGEAVFFVHEREPGEVFRVLVSHGSIEVVGTEFYVNQGEDSGTVHLANGRIIFHDDDGKIRYMQPGDDLTWPRAPQVETPPLQPVERTAAANPVPPRPQPRAHVAAPTPRPPRPAPEPNPTSEAKPEVAPQAVPVPEAKPPRVEVTDEEDGKVAPEPEDEKPLSMEEVLKKMNQLRGQHRYSDEATLLRQQVMRDDFTKPQRARLSFELGTLLQDRLDDRAGACRHWHEHQMLFPNDTEHGEQVQQALESCEGKTK